MGGQHPLRVLLKPLHGYAHCAAVSVLIINTVNSLEAFTDDKFEAKEDDGYVSIRFTAPVTEKGKLLMDSLILGLTEIEHSYNNRYLTVKVKEV